MAAACSSSPVSVSTMRKPAAAASSPASPSAEVTLRKPQLAAAGGVLAARLEQHDLDEGSRSRARPGSHRRRSAGAGRAPWLASGVAEVGWATEQGVGWGIGSCGRCLR